MTIGGLLFRNPTILGGLPTMTVDLSKPFERFFEGTLNSLFYAFKPPEIMKDGSQE